MASKRSLPGKVPRLELLDVAEKRYLMASYRYRIDEFLDVFGLKPSAGWDAYKAEPWDSGGFTVVVNRLRGDPKDGRNVLLFEERSRCVH